jgi:replication initiation protein RepC
MVNGLRKLTTNHLIAARLAEQAKGLPPGIRHPNQLLAALRRAAPYLGCHHLLPLMEELFRWTQPQDWLPGDEPIVWPSNDDLATALGCSERHVSRLVAAAIEARLITAKDGSDRKRRGLREGGRIRWAWGFNLRPMAARYIDFLRASEEGEAARRECRTLRREASAVRQSLAQLLELARTHCLPAPPIEDRLAEAEQLCTSVRRLGDPVKAALLLAKLKEAVQQVRTWLEQAVEQADRSGSTDSRVSPLLLTRTPTEPERSTVEAPEPSAADKESPITRPESGAFDLSPSELVRLAPKLGDYLIHEPASWADVSDAASALAQHLGIPQALYGDACRRLGRRPAAIAVAIISTKSAGHFHSSGAAGYLHGMLRRAEKGELFLERSIFGLRGAAGYRRLKQRFDASTYRAPSEQEVGRVAGFPGAA